MKTLTLTSTWAGAALLVVAGCIAPPELDGRPLSDNVVDWRDEIIYQVVTDRFANGDRGNDFNVNVHDPSAYHGGDWRGLQDKLGYLETLGVTALWISPAVKNVEADAGFASYHGYWTQDFLAPNPHFGDEVALAELVDAAHARGMKVILDIVANHVGQAFYYDINKNGQPDEFTFGQGGAITPIGQGTGTSDLVHVSEWDPDFDARGIQAWTSLGPSGPAPLVFARDPAINRMPPEPSLFAQPYAYNRMGRVTVWNSPQVCGCEAWGCAWDDPCRREQEVRGDFPGGLKDLDTRRQDVRDALFASYAHWIDVADFDGFRIDTLKHVEHEFWEDFAPRIRAHAAARGKQNFLLFGEAFDGDDRLLGSYTHGEGVDSVFYFSQYYTVLRDALVGGATRTCEVERLHCRRLGCASDPCGEDGPIAALYADAPKKLGITGENGEPLSPQQLVVGFLENHDVGRLGYFLPADTTQAERRRVVQLALTYLLTMDGLPALYYGVEQELVGGNDPANRETLWREESYAETVVQGGRWVSQPRRYDADGDGHSETRWEPFDTGNPTFRHVAKLNGLRRSHVALRRGDLVFRWSGRDRAAVDHGLLAYERTTPVQTVLVVLNLDPANERTTENGASTMPVSFEVGTELVDLLEPTRRFPVTACASAATSGCARITVGPRAGRILIPAP